MSPSIKSPFFANHFRLSDFFLLFVETISPLFKKKSVILIAWVNNPPGLFRKSKIYLFIFLFFLKSLTISSSWSELLSLKDVNLTYPILSSNTFDLTDLISILNLWSLIQCLIFGWATGYILIINEPKNCWLRLFLILIISAS